MLYKYKYKTFKKIAKICAPPNTSIARINIYSNSAYPTGYYNDKRDSINIYIGKKKLFPYIFKASKKRGNISSGILSQRQALIFILAHELRHRWQERNNIYIGKKFDRQAERDADLWALKILKETERK